MAGPLRLPRRCPSPAFRHGGGRVGRQDPGPDRDGDRALRGAGRARAGASARRDRARAGHPAPVPARGHAVAEPAGDPGPGQRLDPAPPARGLGGGQPAAAGARRAGRDAARRPGPDPGQLRRARQARRRPDRPEPDRPRQARDQVPHRHHGRRGAGRLRGDGGERQRHAPVRAPVPDRLRRRGQDRDRVRGQRATTPSATASCAGRSGPSPGSTSAAGRTARGWASGAGRSSAATPGCWRTSASPCVTTGSASSSSPCSRPPVSSWLQDASPGNSENRLLR